MTYALKVTGLRDFLAAADAAGPATKKLVREDLRRAVEPVRREAMRLLVTELNPESKQTYGISVRKTGVVAVEGRRRKTTGLRPDWGKTQMRDVLIPSAETELDTVVETLEREAADTFARLFTRRLA